MPEAEYCCVSEGTVHYRPFTLYPNPLENGLCYARRNVTFIQCGKLAGICWGYGGNPTTVPVPSTKKPVFTCQMTGSISLRDIENTLGSQKQHQYHLGSQTISRSALARANETLDYSFFVKLFGLLYERCANRSHKQDFGLKKKLFSLDASLIDVSMKLFPRANYNGTKAAFKLHVGLDHDGLIPAFIAVTTSKVGDQTQAEKFHFPKGSVVVFDKGYPRYKWHAALSQHGVSYVTRMRDQAKLTVIETHQVPENCGVVSDETVYSKR